MSDLFLKNARFIDWRSLEIRSEHLKVERGPHGGVAFVEKIPRDVEMLDCGGRIVTKSFSIGHHHIYSALARGMPMPKQLPSNFVEILELIWWNLDKQLDKEMIRASALAVGVEAARRGSTFIIDHHASPNAAPESLHIIADALDEVGLSHLLCYELSDRDGPERLEAGLAETESYLQSHQGLVGLHASFTVSDELLERAVGIACDHKSGIHVHVAEAESDGEHCQSTFGKSLAQRFSDSGALALPQTILAHCLHLDDAEREIVRSSNAWVVHNTQSNANNNVGLFDPRGLGDQVFIGTDGMHSDMLSAARAMYLEGQAMGGLSPLDAYRRLRRVHDYLESNDFVGDGENNLVVLDYPSPTPITPENWPAHVMYGLTSAHVHSVIASGKVIVEAGQLKAIDEERVLAHAQEQAERLWAKL